MDDLYAVILAGGSGTRFWPASRKARPKQLLAIGKDPEHSLIETTVRRIESFCPAERTLIATGEHLLEATRAALPWLPETSFLGEPLAKNTAPCIGWASAVARRRDPNAMIMVLPSDHHIGDEQLFAVAVRRALASAAGGAIATIGITPTRPETGFGYIEAGEALENGALLVERFVEKPTIAKAEEYLESGRYYWNAGMFFFRAEVMLNALRDHAPEVFAGIERIEEGAAEGDELEATREAFIEMPSISIDYAVMEKASPLAVIPGSFGWSDLGSWESAWELGAKDDDGNVLPAGTVTVDASGNLVRDLTSGSAKKTIALVGVDDLCVIETDDALLVIPRDRAQDVRHAVDALKAAGKDQLL
jgi:mannose-1-phosphate guanylyltransferase